MTKSTINVFRSILELPTAPGVYGMYSGLGRGAHCAYVGIAGNLKQRIAQHLIRRDSSVTTGASAVSLNPDYISEVKWWEHPDFHQRHFLEAAELVAFEILDPVLRSRGAIQDQARQLYASAEFQARMRSLFQSEPRGHLKIYSLQDALEKISELDRRLASLESLLTAK